MPDSGEAPATGPGTPSPSYFPPRASARWDRYGDWPVSMEVLNIASFAWALNS